MDKNKTINLNEVNFPKIALIDKNSEDEINEITQKFSLFAGTGALPSGSKKQPTAQTFKIRIDDNNENQSSHLGAKRTLAHRHKTEPNLQVKVEHDNVRSTVSAFQINRYGKMRKLTNFLGITKRDDDDTEGESNSDDENKSSSPKLFVEHLLQKVRPVSPKLNPGKRKKAPAGGVAGVANPTANQLDPDGEAELDTSGSNVDSKLKQSIKVWRMMKASENMMKLDTIANDSEHQGIIDEITRRGDTEIPIPLQLEIKNEALAIVSKTRQLYKGILRDKNQLTKDAIKRERELILNLYGEEQ